MWCQIIKFSLRNTLKLSRKKKKKSRNPQQCFSKLRRFLRSFDVVFHMFRCIQQTSHQNKKNSWDKTGKGNVVLDYAISAYKYPKMVPQEKKKNTPRSHQFSEIKGFAKIYWTKGIRLNIFFIPSPPPCTPFPSIGGGGTSGQPSQY